MNNSEATIVFNDCHSASYTRTLYSYQPNFVRKNTKSTYRDSYKVYFKLLENKLI